MDDSGKPPITGPASGGSINGFILNLVLPGLGCLVTGRQSGLGAGMLVLFVAGVALLFVLTLLGVVLVAGSWIWSAVVGFQMMSSSTDGNRPPGVS